MDVLKLAKKYVIDSQLFVSFTATLLALFFMTDISAPTVFVLFATYLNGYLYTKFQHNRFLRPVIYLNVFFGLLIILVLLLNFPGEIFLRWLVVVLLGFLYNSSFLEVFIRKIPLLKIFYVGFVWALTSTWIFEPTINHRHFVAVLFFVSALVLPFDIRDMADDEIVTFPKLIGTFNTKIFATFLLILAALPAFFFPAAPQIAFWAALAVSTFLIWMSGPEKPDLFFSFWVESCTALPFFFLILLKYF